MEEVSAYQLPSPANTPYRTPSSTRSRRSQVDDDMSPATTPPPLREEHERSMKRRSNDSMNPALDENISPLDPRRFTPTLHASLVSEILSLRRDLENRTKDIERLETGLHQAHQQNEALNTSLITSNKERRDIKRQMQMLEGGTYTALNDLGKERDDAITEGNEFKRRLEQAYKKAKSYEEVAERTQLLWDAEKESWQAEKRGLETKVQVAEGRLKVVLREIAHAQQHDRPVSPVRRVESRNSVFESPNRRRGRRYSSNSINSDHHGRVSVLSFANGTTINLADELAFDEEEEDHLLDGRLSPDALPEEAVRPASSLSLKARKVLGLHIDLEEPEAREDVDPLKNNQESRRSASYVDTASQFSPPSSPTPWQKAETRSGSKFDDRVDSRSDSRIDSRNESRLSKRNSKPADLRLTFASRQSIAGPTPVSPTESLDSKDAPWNNPGPIMVSSACQTVEVLPTPPLTPEKAEGALETIHESAAESVEMKSAATQTEAIEIRTPKAQKSWQHMPSESGDLQIPLINIIPPASRPPTPDTTTVVLPPRTKSEGMQVDLRMLGTYTSTSMQTEEIRVDRRNLVPASQMPPPNAFKVPISSRAIPPRGRKPAQVVAPAAANQKMNVGITRMPPSTEGPVGRDFATILPRSSSLTQGQPDDFQHNEEDDIFETDVFNDDDFFTRPTAKFMLRSGKMVSQEPELDDGGESFAVTAGEAAALENLRQSEDSMAPDMKKFFQQGAGRMSPALTNGQRPPPAMKPLRRVPSSRSSNMRRAALITAGSSAHRATGSQSTNASFDSTNPPPFPVPLRYSSARITKSMSEGGRSSRASSTHSPTKASKFRGKNILRKSRSGPAISPHAQARKSRSRSPPLDTRVSIVPEMPTFTMPTRIPPAAEQPAFLNEPYLPAVEASAPRPSIATGPRRGTAHMKTNSDALALHQTSVVDSIAQTMVGEWMYKYVRRRKSFGVSDKGTDWDNKSVDEISATVTNNGMRHKRWVWLAPYERAVMWSSKQPTSGSALMGGKSGRKLTIKSVLDVKDDNPMPRGTVIGPHFNRSILILTPQRALKFTATSQERHFVWLTALSFLSHSPLSVNDLNAMPPAPPEAEAMYHQPPPPPSLAGSLRRRPIRDSIRVAKGTKPNGGLRSFTTDGSQHSVPIPSRFDDPEERNYYDPTQDPALPPTIKRFHNRNRSNTAPKAPPSSFRTFNQRDVVPSLPMLNGPGAPGSHAGGSSVITSATGSDRGLYTPSLGMPSVASSRRGSEASNGGRPQGGFFNDFNIPNATMRMDAFIEDRQQPNGPPPIPSRFETSNASNRGGGYGPNGSVNSNNGWGTLRSGFLKKKDMGHWGIEEGRGSVSPVDSLMQNEMMLAESSARPSLDSRMTDPFRGF